MSRPLQTPGIRCVAPLVIAGTLVAVGCGPGSTSRTENAATSIPEAEVTAPSPGDDSTEATEAEQSPDTITPPEISPPETDAEAASTPPDDANDAGGSALTPTQQALADVAIADALERRGLEPGDVDVVDVEEVTWPDGSLGCPQRGMQYQQVLTPGIRVILDAAGQRAFYHGTSVRDLAYCATPTPPTGR